MGAIVLRPAWDALIDVCANEDAPLKVENHAYDDNNEGPPSVKTYSYSLILLSFRTICHPNCNARLAVSGR